MAELAAEGPRYHQELGHYARARVDVIIGIGELARLYEPDHWFPSHAECAAALRGIVREGDCVLVKGSRSLRLERVVNALRGFGQEADRPDGKAR
jgi:UDP-N-acetylmuramoyl-tripeptide--D-alanyl-D-alanine ligase